jgi:hypothetical protein
LLASGLKVPSVKYSSRHTAIDHRWLNGKRSWLMFTALTTGASVRR